MLEQIAGKLVVWIEPIGAELPPALTAPAHDHRAPIEYHPTTMREAASMPTESVPPVPDPKITVAVTTNRARKFLFLVRESKLAAMRARVPDLMASVQRHWTKPTFKIRLQPSCDPVRYDSPNRGNNSTL